MIKGSYHKTKSRRKMSESHKGKPRSEKIKKKISVKLKGKKLPEETKRKIRKTCQGEEFKTKMRNIAIQYLLSGKAKKRNTGIEEKIEKELQRRNLYYQKQTPLCNITVADFYLPEIRTVIYCDGKYWHSLEKVKRRDINQDLILMFHGFNVYRFSEDQINKSARRCINKVLRQEEG